MHPLLSVDALTVRFGGVVALESVSFDVSRGQICGLIGPNGAGKTTLFNCLSRVYTPQAGRIQFDGQLASDLPIHKIAPIGIGRTFQNLALYRTMSVTDNIKVGGHCRMRGGFMANVLKLPVARASEVRNAARAEELIEFLDLRSVASVPVKDLPFGTQKRVELGRALASEPKLLLLDEPAAGLNHEEVESLGNLIVQIRKELKVTILLIEHHMSLVMGVSDNVVVLNFGRKIAEGVPLDVQRNPDVIGAYLGSDL